MSLNENLNKHEYIFDMNMYISDDTWDRIKEKGTYSEIQKAIDFLLTSEIYFPLYCANKSQMEFKLSLILATDIANNNQFHRLFRNKTMIIDGNLVNGRFNMTDAVIVSSEVGIVTDRRIFAQILFKDNGEKCDGFPPELVKEILDMPIEMFKNKDTDQRYEHWIKYLDIVEKKASETEMMADYDSWRLAYKQKRIYLHVKQEISINVKDTWVYLTDTQQGRCLIGNVIDYDRDKNELIISMDMSFRKDYFDNSTKNFPKESVIHITNMVDIANCRNLQYGLLMFSIGKTENPRLEDFIFDGSLAKQVEPSSIVSRSELLQDNLNSIQLQAVNGALSSEDLYLIQGPPGTGKTTVISEICYQNALRNKKTLLVAQDNNTIDSALSIVNDNSKIRAFRKGNIQFDYEEKLPFIEDNVINTWLNNITNSCSLKIDEMQRRINKSDGFDEDLAKLIKHCKDYQTTLSEIEGLIRLNDSEGDTDLAKELEALNKYYKELETNKNIETVFELSNDINFALSEEEQKQIITISTINKRSAQGTGHIKSHEENIVTLINAEDRFKQCINDLEKRIGSHLSIKEDNPTDNEFYASLSLESFNDLVDQSTEIEAMYKELSDTYPEGMVNQKLYMKKWMKKYMSFFDTCNLFFSCSKKMKSIIRDAVSKLKKVNNLDFLIDQHKKDISNHIEGLKATIRNLSANSSVSERQIEDMKATLDTFEEKYNDIKNKYPSIIDMSIFETLEIDDLKAFFSNKYNEVKKDDKIAYDISKKWVKKLREHDENDYEVLKQIYINNSNVVGITCSATGSKNFIYNYPVFDMVIIDGVSKATPPEIILSVLKAKSIVLVGDHRQLIPMIDDDNLQEVAKVLNINEDDLQHIKECLFEKLYGSIAYDNKQMLDIQYRMHPQIMNAINQFYLTDGDGNGLTSGIPFPEETRKHSCEGRGINKDNHILWVDMPVNDKNFEKPSLYGFTNETEAECIKKILITISNNLKENRFEGNKEIGIISFYKEQVRLLEDVLTNERFTKKVDNLDLRIGGVEDIQDSECQIVICSTVRNNSTGEIGIVDNPHLVNTAFSYSKELLVIVGAKELLCKDSNGNNIYANVAEVVNSVGGLRNVHDFEL